MVLFHLINKTIFSGIPRLKLTSAIAGYLVTFYVTLPEAEWPADTWALSVFLTLFYSLL